MVKPKNDCRICQKKQLELFLQLGPSPLANSFVSREQFKTEQFFPLDVYFCHNCSFVQLGHVVEATSLYKQYIYIPSTANTMLVHFGQLAAECILFLNLTTKSFVVDIGSNDGTLLKHFAIHGIRTLGVDPAKNLARLANESGIETVTNFFNSQTARRILQRKGKADLITATNVFAHVDNIHEFLEGIEILLSENGVFVIEFPYLVDLIEKNEFDTIYHEHLSYFTVSPLLLLFDNFDLEIFDIKRIGIHGGSLRVFVRRGKRSSDSSKSVKMLIKLEKKGHLNKIITYRQFAKRVKLLRDSLLRLLQKIKSQRQEIVGLGAPAKGNTLLNYCGITQDLISFIADSTPTKWGLFTPGTHIPIYEEKRLSNRYPDYLLILAWNFAEEIIKKQAEFQQQGGKFIIPIPQVVVL